MTLGAAPTAATSSVADASSAPAPAHTPAGHRLARDHVSQHPNVRRHIVEILRLGM